MGEKTQHKTLFLREGQKKPWLKARNSPQELKEGLHSELYLLVIIKGEHKLNDIRRPPCFYKPKAPPLSFPSRVSPRIMGGGSMLGQILHPCL